MNDPRTFTCFDDDPIDNKTGNGTDWTRLEEFYEKKESDNDETDQDFYDNEKQETCIS